MSETKVNTKNTEPTGVFIDLVDKVSSLIGREPNSHELRLLEILSLDPHQKKLLIADKQINTKIYKLTDTISCVLKTASVSLNHQSNIEAEAEKCISRLGNKIMKEKAKPIGFCNVFKLGNIEPDKSKFILRALIQGSSRISNTLGIPTLNTKTFFNQHKHQQFFHSASVGILHSSLNETKPLNTKNISVFFFGKKPELLQNQTAIKTGNSYTAHEIKYLHDALQEFSKIDPSAYYEQIDEGGLVSSMVKILINYKKGPDLDLSIVQGTSNDLSWLFCTNEAAMIIITDKEKQLLELSWKWSLDCIVLGKLSDFPVLKLGNNDQMIIELPENAILTFIKSLKPPLVKNQKNTHKKLIIKSIPAPNKLKEVAWFLLRHQNISAKKCVNEQYNSMAGGATINTNFPSDVEILNLKGTNKAVALSISDNPEYIENDPETGAQLIVAELARKMVCSGAKPLGIRANIFTSNHHSQHLVTEVNGLNQGLKSISDKFNISCEIGKFFTSEMEDERDKNRVDLSISISMLGIIHNKNHHMTMSFKDKGNIIFLIGRSKEDLACSEYLCSYHGNNNDYQLIIDAEIERKIQLSLIELITKNYICSAHNISKGGLFISLVESALVHGFGFDIITDTDIRTDAFLFAESPGRVIVSVTPHKEDKFIDFMMQKEIPFLALGHVTKGEMRIDDISFGFIEDAKKVYFEALGKYLNMDDQKF